MSDFKGRHFRGEIVLWAVRWYCRYPISYRDLEAMMTERGVAVDHSTIYRWVQRFAPEMEKRLRRQWRRPQSRSWRVDEKRSPKAEKPIPPAATPGPGVPAQRHAPSGPRPSGGAASARQVRGSFFPAMSPRANERLLAVSKSLDFPAALRSTRPIPHAEGAEAPNAACTGTVAGSTRLPLASLHSYV